MTQYSDVPLEIKAITGRLFSGYGAVFGNVDRGGDIVVPGAFKKSLEQHRDEGTMPSMFWMHHKDEVPGVWLDMREDRKGLGVDGEILDTVLGKDVQLLLSRKAVRGLSIGYVPKVTDWDRDGNRLLKEVELVETSIVSIAMNPLARIEQIKARLSRDGEYVPTERELEDLLRKAGCSRNVSRLLVAKMMDGEVDTSGMLDDDTSGTLGDAEEDRVLKSLLALTDTVYATALKR